MKCLLSNCLFCGEENCIITIHPHHSNKQYSTAINPYSDRYATIVEMCPCDSIPSHWHSVYFLYLVCLSAEPPTRCAHFPLMSPLPFLFLLIVAVETTWRHSHLCFSLHLQSYFIIPSLRDVTAGMLDCTFSFLITSQMIHFQHTYRQSRDSHDTLAVPVAANPCASRRSYRCNDAEALMDYARSIRSSSRRCHHPPVASTNFPNPLLTFRFIKSWNKRRR